MGVSFISPIPVIRHQPQQNWNHRRVPAMMTEPVTETANEATDNAKANTSSASAACPACGREAGIASGCNGEGRIQGGLGAVVKWWPIKAYRPCPDYLKAKKTYQRAGQSLDEIAFGRKGSGDDLSITERLQGK